MPPASNTDEAQPAGDAVRAAIAALQAQRQVLGDTTVDAAIAALGGRSAPVQALRQVTLLFLDVVGSTPLAQLLDPEEVQDVMDTALAACTGIVSDHGGQVLQYAGDSLLAVFGAVRSQEDDAERAVRAGLALRDEGVRQGRRVLQRHGYAGFDVRVGLHTGPVLLDGERSVRGIAVNVAARMEQTAPPGGLRISSDTHAQVRGLFDVERQEPMAVKGLERPMVTYLVQGVRPRAFRVASRGIEGMATAMVGRDKELARLCQALRAVAEERRARRVTVVAEAGIGKSRLLYEFHDELTAARCQVMQARAHPGSRRQPYGLLRDLLAAHLGIGDGDALEPARRRFEDGMAPGCGEDGTPAPAEAQLLGHLLGLNFGENPRVRELAADPRRLRRRAFDAAMRWFRQLALQQAEPLVLMLEDLHWADDGSLDFIDHLMDGASASPLLVLGTARPELFERRPDGQEPADGERITLRPLGAEGSARLVAEVLRRLPEVPAELHEMLSGTAEGNPFYLEELVKMLVDEGAIVVGEGGWKLDGPRLRGLRVPPTLTGVLQARLDSLGSATRLALQQASAIGYVFWDQALAAIDRAATEQLPEAGRRALINARQEAGIEGVREFAFHHHLLQQVAYGTLLKRHRRDYHARVGAWLAAVEGVRANDFLAIAAEHFEKAEDFARAAQFYLRAAEHAAARHAHALVIDCVARALALPEPDDGDGQPESQNEHAALQARLLDLRVATYGLIGQRDLERADIAALERLAEQRDDDAARWQVLWRRIELALRTADYRGLLELSRAAMALGLRLGDAEKELCAQQRHCIALAETGDGKASEALTRDGLTRARELALPSMESFYLNMLSVLLARRGEHWQSLLIDQQKMALAQRIGNVLNLAMTTGNLAVGWLSLGAFDRARPPALESLRLTRESGDIYGQCLHLLTLAAIDQRLGDAAGAQQHAEAALALAVKQQSREAEARSWNELGQTRLLRGELDAAAQAFERADEVAVAGDSEFWLDAAAGQALVAQRRGDAAASRTAVRRILDHLQAGGTLESCDRPALLRLTCHRVLAEAGDAAADAILAAACDEIKRTAAAIEDAEVRRGYLHDIAEHRELLALNASPPG